MSRPRLIALVVGLTATGITIILLFVPAWRDLVRVNFFYYLTLLLIFFVPSFLLFEVYWARSWPPMWFWSLSFLTTGAYYTYFEQPNLLDMIWSMALSWVGEGGQQLTGGDWWVLTYAMMAWLGLVVLSYELATRFAAAGNREAIDRYDDFSAFSASQLMFLIYLNLAIDIVKPLFGRGL